MTPTVLAFPPAPMADVQGTLALDLTPRHELPPVDPRVVRRSADVIEIGERRRDELESWVARFVQAACEIVGGDRPASQLVRWSSASVHADLERRAQVVAQAGGHAPGQGRVQPVRPKVVSVHLSFTGDRVAESAIRVRYGPRSRAVAARFERIRSLSGERWVCTALHFG